jgi:hypothetical protein
LAILSDFPKAKKKGQNYPAVTLLEEVDVFLINRFLDLGFGGKQELLGYVWKADPA